MLTQIDAMTGVLSMCFPSIINIKLIKCIKYIEKIKTMKYF